MSHRLQVLIPEALNKRVQKAAHRQGVSNGAWVRRALERALDSDRSPDPLEALSALGAPTGDIDRILDEIEAGRR